MPDTPAPISNDSDSEDKAAPGTCPHWCAGCHDDEPALHCSEAVLVPGIALVPSSTARVGTGNLSAGEGCIGLTGGNCAVGVTLSVVLHQRGNCPLVWVHIGDGSPQGLEISVETAWLLVRGLGVVLGGEDTRRSDRQDLIIT